MSLASLSHRDPSAAGARLAKVLICVLGLFGFPGALGVRAAAGSQGDRVALVGVQIVRDDGRIADDMVVEIEAGRIRAVEPAAGYRASAGTRAIALPGRYLVPGYVDTHMHLLLHPWDENGEIRRQYDRGALLRFLRLLLASGVTTIRDPGAPTEAAVTFRALVERGIVEGPSIVSSGRILTASDFDPEPFVTVRTEEQVREEVRWQARAGVDFVKVYASMPPVLVKAAVEEAHAHGLRVVGHLGRTSWTEAARLGIDGLCHASDYAAATLPEAARAGIEPSLLGRAAWFERVDLESPQFREMVGELASRRVAVDPTLIALHSKFFGDRPEYREHPKRHLMPEIFWKGYAKGSFTAGWSAADYRTAQASWPRVLAYTRALHRGGVLMTVGTDAPTPWIIPGVSFHEELRLLASAGVPNGPLLAMATRNAAVAMGLEREIGAVEPGLRADLVVLGSNPLERIENAADVEMVVARGRIFRPAELLAE